MLSSTITALRALLDGTRVLTIAVIVDGAPQAGLLPFAVLPGYGGVLVHASQLSRHAQGLAAGGGVSILLHEQDTPGKDALQLQRVTFECRVHPLERGSEAWAEARNRYVERFPDGEITFRLGDFTLYRLEFLHGLYVAGFGRAIQVPPGDVAKLR